MSIFEDTNPRVLKELLRGKESSPFRYLSDIKDTPDFPFEKVEIAFVARGRRFVALLE